MLSKPGLASEPIKALLRLGKRSSRFAAKELFFSEGGSADHVFYLQAGQAKITANSPTGQTVLLSVAAAGEFLGDAAILQDGQSRSTTVTAMSECYAIKFRRLELIGLLQTDSAFSHVFLTSLLVRAIRSQDDRMDLLVNSCEKRLARILLLMAQPGDGTRLGSPIPAVTQQELADMVGTTRSRISFFMNQFRKRGLIDYNRRIWVNASLVVVLERER
jgi:CRP/FNR family cyclic AMP-dependent transcriptional regulator